jgi:Ca2+:H+ antiporter
MRALFNDIRRNPMLWLLGFLPVLIFAELRHPGAHTILFVLSILSLVPLSVLLSRATESLAAKTGDVVGGLLNATFGNFAELVIALTALNAGEYVLVKATLTGGIITKALFILGISLLLGGFKYQVQEFNRAGARLQASLLFLATVALLFPSVLIQTNEDVTPAVTQNLSLALAALLLPIYGLGLLFSLKTHREFFAESAHVHHDETVWPPSVALAVLGFATVLMALVSHVFVGSVQIAATELGITPAFVGLIIVSLVSGSAEMTAAAAAARKNRVDLSVGVALGGAVQMALFVAPALVLLSYFLGPSQMSLQFWPGAVAMMLIATAAVALITNSGRSAWFVGALLVAVYLMFATTLYILPPAVQ